ncbi:hypothetical protein SK128_014727, partial [Halocaridina rubra]
MISNQAIQVSECLNQLYVQAYCPAICPPLFNSASLMFTYAKPSVAGHEQEEAAETEKSPNVRCFFLGIHNL